MSERNTEYNNRRSQLQADPNVRAEFIADVRATHLFHPGEPALYFALRENGEFQDSYLEHEFIGYCLGRARQR